MFNPVIYRCNLLFLEALPCDEACLVSVVMVFGQPAVQQDSVVPLLIWLPFTLYQLSCSNKYKQECETEYKV